MQRASIRQMRRIASAEIKKLCKWRVCTLLKNKEFIKFCYIGGNLNGAESENRTRTLFPTRDFEEHAQKIEYPLKPLSINTFSEFIFRKTKTL